MIHIGNIQPDDDSRKMAVSLEKARLFLPLQSEGKTERFLPFIRYIFVQVFST
jgi:hypothetical protein